MASACEISGLMCRPRRGRGQLRRLPAWVDHQLVTDNLDVRELADAQGLWRFRVGNYRAVFQVMAPKVGAAYRGNPYVNEQLRIILEVVGFSVRTLRRSHFVSLTTPVVASALCAAGLDPTAKVTCYVEERP